MVTVFGFTFLLAMQITTIRQSLVSNSATLLLCMLTVLHLGAPAAQETSATLLPDEPDYCPAYTGSAVYRQPRAVINIDPSDDWINIVEQAAPGTEILFDNGTYKLDRELVAVGHGVTLRSASGNRDAVVIKGAGYRTNSQGLVIVGDKVTIADLTIRDLRDHAIYVKPDIAGGVAPLIYNVHAVDIGTQHIKSNTGSTGGIIACSKIGYTASGAKGDYNGAIDLHGALGWTIRDNEIYNITGDGSGCNVSRNCNRYVSAPAILVWNDSRDTVVERNNITESYRNIAFGLGSRHEGGIIRNNTIFRTTRGDAGIELQGARGTLVENNTVLLYDGYRGAIEYRETRDIVVRSNQVTSLWNRGKNFGANFAGNTVVEVPKVFKKKVAGCSSRNL